MGFAVTCKSCQARFLLNDDLLKRRVAGRVVTVRCRQCQGTIEVDASNVDPVTLTESMRPDALEEILAPVKPAMPKPPPRPPAKSTLMGIGAARPAGAKELVALSPGLLGVETKPKPPQPLSAHGFPEPPPPPSGGAIEELSSADWQISEPPPAMRPAVANETTIVDSEPPSSAERIDEFVESLPSSVPPAEEDPAPSSSGTPSLQALAHHDQKVAAGRKQDDFFLNMSAALNGGMAPEMSAPTIDVSNLGAKAESSRPGAGTPGVDVPLKGGQTLPLFAMGDPATALLNTPAPKSSIPPKLPSTESKPPSSSRGPDTPRERKNVVAPVEKKTKEEASPPSRLAGPLLLALAAAAGFLIWKSGAGGRAVPEPTPEATPAAEAMAQPEPAKVTEPAPTLVAPTTPSAAAAAAPTATPADTAAKAQPASTAAATHSTPDKATTTAPAGTATTPSAATEKPAAPAAPEPKPDAAAAAPTAPKEEPAAAPAEAAPPAEPAGPFDRAAAAAALNTAAAQASSCRKDGDPSGIASVTITFAPSGRVTSANISGPPFAGTPTGGCIASTLRKAKIPPFDGDRVTVSKTITIQ